MAGNQKAGARGVKRPGKAIGPDHVATQRRLSEPASICGSAHLSPPRVTWLRCIRQMGVRCRYRRLAVLRTSHNRPRCAIACCGASKSRQLAHWFGNALLGKTQATAVSAETHRTTLLCSPSPASYLAVPFAQSSVATLLRLADNTAPLIRQSVLLPY